MFSFFRTLSLTVFAGLSLSACVTSQSADGIDPEMETIAKNVLSEMCVLNSVKGSFKKSEGFNLDEIYISHIKQIRTDVYQASTYYRGFGSNVTFDIGRARAACGTNSTKLYPSDYLVGYVAINGGMRKGSGETRPIAVSWEGYAELFSGTIEEIGNGERGAVNITLPNNDGHCSGNYQATSKAKGTWTISCTNDLQANGTYTAFGDGKGASGTGKDKQGRSVTYTIGGRF